MSHARNRLDNTGMSAIHPHSQPICPETPSAHLSQDTTHRISLTLCGAPPAHSFVDQLAHLAQQVGAEERATSADRDHRIGHPGIRPFDRQRAQPSGRVQIRHTVPTPVVADSQDFEGLPLQWMERMRNSENL